MTLSSDKLYQYLSDGDWHSGQDLADSLGVSRTIVWKNIEKLRAKGVEIEASSGKGYRLAPDNISLFCEKTIRQQFSAAARQALSQLIISDVVGSTNDECMRYVAQQGDAQSADNNSILVLAEQQTAGRGRRGKTWFSPYASSLYMSMSFRFEQGAASLAGLSLVVGLAVANALELCGLPDVQLKWPNDIVLSGKKLGGILLELTGDIAGPCYAVIGIGVNLKLPAEAAEVIDQPYTDVHALSTAVAGNKNRIAATIVNELCRLVDIFRQQGFEPFRKDWLKRDCYLGQVLVIRSGEALLATGEHTGVDVSGAIILDTSEGIKSFNGGEVSLRTRQTITGDS